MGKPKPVSKTQPAPDESPKAPTHPRRLSVAYLLWAVGGVWGLHHLYIGRPRQAFLWWATLGGFFGYGCFRDSYRIPDYVSDANEPKKHGGKPALATGRLAAELMFGFLCAMAVLAGMPAWMLKGEMAKFVMAAFVPAAVAWGVHLVANIGSEQAALKWSMAGAYLVYPLFSYNATVSPGTTITYTAVASAVLTNWRGKSWRAPGSPLFKYRFESASLILAMIIYLSLWTSAFYSNAYITTSDGIPVKLTEAMPNIKGSQFYKHPWNTVKLLWSFHQINGFGGIWREVLDHMDPAGEHNAYDVLGVPLGSTQDEIKDAYKELVKQFHPDRNPEFQEKFMEIQKSFDIASALRSRRNKANQRSRKQDKRPL